MTISPEIRHLIEESLFMKYTIKYPVIANTANNKMAITVVRITKDESR
jgi:hypothetical protein